MKLLFEQELYEMARVGFTSDSYEVYVNTNDAGNIPHFHYRQKDDWNKFHTCIQITSPKYFHHTGKEDVLNIKQKKNLIEFLNSPYKNYGITVFRHLIDMWNDNNSSVQVDENITIPDYMSL